MRYVTVISPLADLVKFEKLKVKPTLCEGTAVFWPLLDISSTRFPPNKGVRTSVKFDGSWPGMILLLRACTGVSPPGSPREV